MDPITSILAFLALVGGFFILREWRDDKGDAAAPTKQPADRPVAPPPATPQATASAPPIAAPPTATTPAGQPPRAAASPTELAASPASRDRQARLAAAAALGELTARRATLDRDGRQALQALGELSLDLDATVRAAAVAALGRIPDAAAIPYLERALRDRDLEVIAAASEAIARYKFYPSELEIAPPLPANGAPTD